MQDGSHYFTKKGTQDGDAEDFEFEGKNSENGRAGLQSDSATAYTKSARSGKARKDPAKQRARQGSQLAGTGTGKRASLVAWMRCIH